MEKPHINGYRRTRQLKIPRQLTGNWRDFLLAVLAITLLVLVNIQSNGQPAHSAASNPDLNHDGVVNLTDLSIALSSWNTAGGDTNGDGLTNLTDLSIILSAWGTHVPLPTPATPTPTPTPASPSGEAMPVGDLPGWRQTLAQDFNSPAVAGLSANGFKSVYASNWCGYNEGQGGYFNNEVLSAHDGVMDFTLNGTQGAAGSFGDGVTCGQLYGRFSMRFKAVDAGSYGTAIMVWPNGDTWGNGEVDYPEGDFDNTFNANQHGINCTDCSSNVATFQTHTSFTDWHTATTEWTPSGIKYYLDGTLIGSHTGDVPFDNHRYTIQIAPTHTPVRTGHFLIDWVAIYAQN